MKKQTAVEFAVEKLEKLIPSGNQLVIGAILEKAIKMEKEQIINAYNKNLTGFNKLEQEESGLNWAEDYYNETFNK